MNGKEGVAVRNEITLAVVSSIGNSRTNQEDNYIVAPNGYLLPSMRARQEATRETVAFTHSVGYPSFLAAVSDGMGGHACGEVASGETVKYLSDHYDEVIGSVMYGEAGIIPHIAALNRHVAAIAAQNVECRTMGATLCGVVCRENALYGFNVGDSRLYRFERGELTQLSTDHTEGQRLLSLNLLSAEEVENFPKRKSIYKYIGIRGADLVAQVFPIESHGPGTVLLLCSDGVTDAVPDSEIASILSYETGLEEKGRMLLDTAMGRHIGRGDNITILLVQF